MMDKAFDIIIIGGGQAGLSATTYGVTKTARQAVQDISQHLS